MGCTKKVYTECSQCGGSGTKHYWHNNSDSYLSNNGKIYHEPTGHNASKKCPYCDGTGKRYEIESTHDFDYEEAMSKDWYYARCKKCGKYENQV